MQSTATYGRSTAICLVEIFRWIAVVLCNRLEWLDPISTEVKDDDPDNFLPDKCQYIFVSKVNFIQVPSINLFWMDAFKYDFSLVNRRSNRHAQLLPAELK